VLVLELVLVRPRLPLLEYEFEGEGEYEKPNCLSRDKKSKPVAAFASGF